MKIKKEFQCKKLFIGIIVVLALVCSILSLTFIKKKSPLSASAEEWYAPSNKGSVEVYQLAPNSGWLMNSYVVKTANGKLIVIDGGEGGSDSTHNEAETAGAYMPTALRAIAGVGAGEYFEVEAWFISHGHEDHFTELMKTLNGYTASSNFKINHFYFDIPEYKTGANPNMDEWGATLKAGFNNYAKVNNIVTSGDYYKDLNGAVINEEAISKGLNINIDGVRFEILQTYSDTDAADVNSDCIVFRMWANDTSFLFLNDTGMVAAAHLIETYGTTLASDYVQLAHHGQDAMSAAQYEQLGIKAGQGQKYLWATPQWIWNNTTTYSDIINVYNQVHGTALVTGDKLTRVDGTDFVAGLYSSYPTTLTSYTDWANCVAGMKVASIQFVETDFAIVGTQIRTTAPEGLRFVAQVTDEAVEKYSKTVQNEDGTTTTTLPTFGILLIPEAMDNTQWLKFTQTTDITDATSLTNTNAIRIDAKSLWDDELCKSLGTWNSDDAADAFVAKYDIFSCAIVDGDIPMMNFINRPFTAVGYIIPADGSDVIYTERLTRSTGYVATVVRLESNYLDNPYAIVDTYADAATWTFTVNGGKVLQTTDKISPNLLLAGVPATTSNLVKVEYSTDDENVVAIVDGNKIQARGNGTATVTATVKRVDNDAIITTQTTTVVSYIDQVKFDSALQKNQLSATEDVVFSLDNKGYDFTVKEKYKGATVNDSNYVYDATAQTLTFTSEYLNTFAVGAYTYELNVADPLNTKIDFCIGAFGTAAGDHLAFSEIVQSVNNFDAIPRDKISDYLTTDPASNVYVNGSYVTAAIVTDDEAIEGHSLKLTKDAANYEAFKPFFTFNFNFEAGVEYKISMNLKCTGQSWFIVRFDNAGLTDQNYAATGLKLSPTNVMTPSANGDAWGANTFIDNDEDGDGILTYTEGMVISWHGIVKTADASKKLTFCCAGAEAFEVIIDNLSITRLEASAPTFDTENRKVQMGESEDVSFTFDSTGHTGNVTVDGVVIDKTNYTYSLSAKTITFKSSYLNTLSAGTHHFKINVTGCTDEAHNKSFDAYINVYGDADGEHLKVLDLSTGFEYSSVDTLTSNTGIAAANNTTAELVGNEILGTSLKLTSGASAWSPFLTSNFQCEANTLYRISFKFKLVEDGGILIIRFANGDLNESGYLATGMKFNPVAAQFWSGITTSLSPYYSYDATTGVYIFTGYIQTPNAGEAITFITSGGGGTYIIDDLSITKVGATPSSTTSGTTATAFDVTQHKAQTEVNGTVTFSFDATGHDFYVRDNNGEIAKTNYIYDAVAKTLTFKASYVNSLPRGANVHQIVLPCSANTHAAIYTFNILPYGTSTDYLAFPDDIHGANNFELIGGVRDFVSTDPAQAVHTPLNNKEVASSGAASMTDIVADGIDGRSLKIITSDAAVADTTSRWTDLLGFRLGFESNTTYHVTMQLQYTLPQTAIDNGTAGTLILRFDEYDAGAWSINVGQYTQAATKWGASHGFSYDPETKILTVDAYVTTSAAGQVLYLTTADSTVGDGAWTILIDNLCITKVA